MSAHTSREAPEGSIDILVVPDAELLIPPGTYDTAYDADSAAALERLHSLITLLKPDGHRNIIMVPLTSQRVALAYCNTLLTAYCAERARAGESIGISVIFYEMNDYIDHTRHYGHFTPTSGVVIDVITGSEHYPASWTEIISGVVAEGVGNWQLNAETLEEYFESLAAPAGTEKARHFGVARQEDGRYITQVFAMKAS
jgi:hypothetical protein